MLLSIATLLVHNQCAVEKTKEYTYEYHVPENTGDGWETASLSDAGIRQANLEMLMNWAHGEKHLLHSLLIVRNGKLVFEEYFPGTDYYGTQIIYYDRDTQHFLWSVTKSYTSALLGIAIQRGFIRDVSQRIFDFFPELAFLDSGSKSDLTIEHMITMSSGLRWDQTRYPIDHENNDIMKMKNASNPWEMYLSRPLSARPGEKFLYSEASINVVGEIIRRTSGKRLDRFATQYLFEPLGIDRSWWALVNPRLHWIWASGDLRQRPRDMAKFGQLYLQGGKWQGEQIIPKEWIESTVQTRFRFSIPFWSLQWGLVAYGYAWWMKDDSYGPGAFCASGLGDQYIIVMPAHDMVVVFTRGSYHADQPPKHSHQIMLEYILPAIE